MAYKILSIHSTFKAEIKWINLSYKLNKLNLYVDTLNVFYHVISDMGIIIPNGTNHRITCWKLNKFQTRCYRVTHVSFMHICFSKKCYVFFTLNIRISESSKVIRYGFLYSFLQDVIPITLRYSLTRAALKTFFVEIRPKCIYFFLMHVIL